MDTLFEIFCECAELNPEPVDGNYNLVDLYIIFVPVDTVLTIYYFPNSRHVFLMIFVEDEGEHDWVFSADQLESGDAGTTLVFGFFVNLIFLTVITFLVSFLFPYLFIDILFL